MKLGSIRELSGNKPVLKDQNSTGPDPVYWVFSELSNNDRFANLTVITPGNYSKEFPKTFGHYHGSNVDETYHLIEGEGVLQLQSKHFENGDWIHDMVDKVYLIKAKPGDEILITPKWGHSWSNTGKLPLLSFDDWRAGHTPADYEVIEKLQGLAYYLVDEGGEIKIIANPKYRNLPEPEWISAEDFKKLTQKP